MSLKISVLESAPYHDMDDQDPPQYRRHNRSSLRRRHYSLSIVAIAALAGFLLCYLLQTTVQTTQIARSSLSLLPASKILGFNDSAKQTLTRPENITVIGLIFYGRPMFVNILECYLRQNLRENGGWLDEIHFIANTAHEEDLDWLDDLVSTTTSYIKVDDLKGPWPKLWTYTERFDPETIFVKIDDDVVYMHEEAVPRLVTSIVAHPEAYAVGGHIVNTPHSQFWQYHIGALLPYLPDPEPVLEDPATMSWRASDLPYYDHDYPPVFDWDFHALPQYNMTRWLPLRPTALQNSSTFPSTSRNLIATPAWNASWTSPRGGWTMFPYHSEITSWAMAAQVHYSFLAHLESPTTILSKYNFMHDGQAWNQQWERYSVNFMAVRAGKMARQGLFLFDEIMITMGVSKEHEEPFLIDMGALVSHYSFGEQHALLKTDLLARYSGYANEMVCGIGNQKSMITSNMTRTEPPVG